MDRSLVFGAAVILFRVRDSRLLAARPRIRPPAVPQQALAPPRRPRERPLPTPARPVRNHLHPGLRQPHQRPLSRRRRRRLRLRSQHCRNDCPLVTLGLSNDESGFKLRNEVLTGNIAGALDKLCVPPLRGQAAAALPTVTTDAGLSIAENVAWLARARQYDWTKVQRGRGGKAGQRRGRQGQTRR